MRKLAKKRLKYLIFGENKISGHMSDIECYLKIIEYIESKNPDQELILKLVSQVLVKLMESLKHGRDKDIIKNGMLLALSYLDNSPPHAYHCIGENCINRSTGDKRELNSLLRDEFLPN